MDASSNSEKRELIDDSKDRKFATIVWPHVNTRICPFDEGEHIGQTIQSSSITSRNSPKWASALSSSPRPPQSSSRQRVSPVTTSPAVNRHKFQFANHYKKVVLSVLLVIMATFLWVTTTQLAKSTYLHQDVFVAPFFVVYFTTSWIILIYPIFLLGKLVSSKGKLSLKKTIKESVEVYSDDGINYRPLKVAAKIVGFSILFVLTSYVYVRALEMKPCLDVITLFSTNSSFVYLLSWIVLQKQFMGIKIVAIILAMTGICMVTYMDGGFSSKSMWGAVLAVTSTSGAASYKVLFKKVAGEATLNQISLFLSCISGFSIITLWPLLLLLYFTSAESIEWDRVPWGYLCGTAGTVLLLNLTLNHGASVTYPAVLQITFMMAIPACAAVDLLYRRETFSGIQIGATVVILVSSLLTLVPDNWQSYLCKAALFRPNRETRTAEQRSNTTVGARTSNTTGSTQRKSNLTFLSSRQALRSTAC